MRWPWSKKPEVARRDWHRTGRRREVEISRSGSWAKMGTEAEYVDFVSGSTEWRFHRYSWGEMVTHVQALP